MTNQSCSIIKKYKIHNHGYCGHIDFTKSLIDWDFIFYYIHIIFFIDFIRAVLSVNSTGCSFICMHV